MRNTTVAPCDDLQHVHKLVCSERLLEKCDACCTGSQLQGHPQLVDSNSHMLTEKRCWVPLLPRGDALTTGVLITGAALVIRQGRQLQVAQRKQIHVTSLVYIKAAERALPMFHCMPISGWHLMLLVSFDTPALLVRFRTPCFHQRGVPINCQVLECRWIVQPACQTAVSEILSASLTSWMVLGCCEGILLQVLHHLRTWTGSLLRCCSADVPGWLLHMQGLLCQLLHCLQCCMQAEALLGASAASLRCVA